MSENGIKTYRYENGEIQRVQTYVCDDPAALTFVRPGMTPAAFDAFCGIYENMILPKAGILFGELAVFYVPEGMEVPSCSFETGTADPSLKARFFLREHIRGGKLERDDAAVRPFLRALEEQGYFRILHGKRKRGTVLMPLNSSLGFLSDGAARQKAVINSSFFVMDTTDCGSLYDKYGTPLGLCVKDGTVLNPPLFGREALLIGRDGSSRIACPSLAGCRFGIGTAVYEPGKNAVLYERPADRFAPAGTNVVITGNRVADICTGRTKVPSSGYVLAVEGPAPQAGAEVRILGFEEIAFGVQVGNSCVVNGEKTTGFVSRFWDVKKPWTVSTPPSLYPLDFEKDRAPRSAIGTDRDGKVVLVLAEGAGKLGYVPGRDSCGASLSEMAEICADLGLVNAVNLDGGGSSMLFIAGRRELTVSGRDPKTGAETERPVPMGIAVL